MVEKILDKASYSIVRTNPKLTGNVKVVSNGSDIYLESFSANRELSSARFKAFKVSGTSTYDKDVFRFFQLGQTPKDIAYDVFQEFRDTAVSSAYKNQYEMFYSAGTRSVASTSFPEDLGMLAPLWLNEQMPKYFVIFRLDDPAAVNNINAETENINQTKAQTAEDFQKNVLNNCTAIKTFDLTENSVLGSYIRNYRNQESFPETPLTISWREDEKLLWNGISLEKGGFKSAGGYSFYDLVRKDQTIMQNEFFFTEGFKRNGILLANLLNLEFLFTDTNAPDYSINRYFGMYVNDIKEGEFDISGEGFYKNSEKSQLPVIKTVTEVSEKLNTPFEITNDQGVLVFLDPNRSTTITGFPTPKRVEDVSSIFYVKDKIGDFHTVKRGSQWGNNEIRLFDKKIDISLLAGFQEPDTFANGKLLSTKGRSVMTLKIIDELTTGIEIRFKDNKSGGNVAINASSTAAPNPGTSSFNSFCPLGQPQEIARAITSAINNGILDSKRFFEASFVNDTVYVQSRFVGSRFNEMTFEINYDDYPLFVDKLISYPNTDLTDLKANFIGGNDLNNSRIKVKLGDEDRFIQGNSIQAKNGFGTIGVSVPYLEEPIKDELGNIVGYDGVNDFVVITTDSDQVLLTNNGQAALYKDYKSEFGRFSFFPIKDFDYDFYSELYSELGELKIEEDHYNKFDPVTGTYQNVAQNPEVRAFYDGGGFANLIGLLRDSDPDVTTDPDIKSPYKRLEENFIRSQAISSRTSPYINKWSWYNGGKDVRNHPYSLNLNEAFGINNFAPSKYAIGQDALGFTHEWPYLCEFPLYMQAVDKFLPETWSYVDNAPIDTKEADITTGQVYTPGSFQRVDINEFDKFFVIDRFSNKVTGMLPSQRKFIPSKNTQVRYGRFKGGDRKNYAETFLRGVRIIAKTKASNKIKPNFNAKKIKYITNGDFNDYKFSAMIIPNAPRKPKTQIKFVKNEKWKTITMMIFLTLKNGCVNKSGSNFEQSIDRTTLYSFESDYKTSICVPIGAPNGPFTYLDGTMEGAVSFTASSFDASQNQFLIQAQPTSTGLAPRFLRDVQLGADGQFTPIIITLPPNATTGVSDVFEISKISKVINDFQLFAGAVVKINGSAPLGPVSLPSISPSGPALSEATYTTKGGGFNTYTNRLTEIGFATLFTNVNLGDPSVIYETIQADGTRVENSDGSIAQTFSIELRAQEDILKSVYLGVLPDPAKPTVFNLTDIIGFDLSLQKKPRITPIGRHAGYYEPTALDLIYYKAPYGGFDYALNPPTEDAVYKEKVFELCRFANAEFMTESNGKQFGFGQIKNLFYHKVNEEDPSAVLELSEESAFQSVYPLISEVGIEKRDFYAFSSNWEPSYFRKSIDKATTEDIIGTRSMQEKKSFFGSKYLKVPQEIILETFVPATEFIKDAIKQPSLSDGDFMIQSNATSINFYMFIQKRLKEFLFTPVKEQFVKYIKPEFSFDDDETLDDDVNRYIEDNILRLYMVENIDVYNKLERARKVQPSNVRSALTTTDDFSTALLSNSEKVNSGLEVVKNSSSILLNTNPFDLRLIYNKRKGFTESFGFSVTIKKK